VRIEELRCLPTKSLLLKCCIETKPERNFWLNSLETLRTKIAITSAIRF